MAGQRIMMMVNETHNPAHAVPVASAYRAGAFLVGPQSRKGAV